METTKIRPFYISLSCRFNQFLNGYNVQTTPDDTTTYANAILYSTSPLLEKASNYLMFVERMECSTNGIPFYDATNIPAGNRETITIRSKLNNALTTTQDIDLSAYSLSHLLDILSSYEYVDPNDATAIDTTFSINKDGFINFTLAGKTFTTLQFEFPPRLNQILGISTADQLDGYNAAASSLPRVDLGDEFGHLIISTTLPTVSDQVGNVKLNVLTDFSSPTQYSNSLSYGGDGNLIRAGFTTNLRQKLIYTPAQRRYIELIGDFPIYDIRCEAFYINNEEVLKRVPLAYGGSFEIKLGFYQRTV